MPEAIFVTVAEAAKMLALAKGEVYELASAGHLGPKKYIGRGTRNFRLEVARVRQYADQLPETPVKA